jgi:hypothetical protein
MRKLTDVELKEPDVVLTIPYDRFSLIPKTVWDELSAYIGRDTGRSYIYRLPAYLARALEEMVQP